MYKRTIVKVLILFIVVLTFFTITGCKKKNNGSSGSITIWWPGGSDTVQKGILDAKAQYEKEHPGTTINIKFQSTNDFYASYTMALMGKDFPDVAYVDHVFVQRLAFDGLTANLSDLGLESTKDNYINSLWEPNLYNGKLYALPMSANILSLVYNKALLTKVTGEEFTKDKLPKNWDEYIALGQKINAYNEANNLTGNDKLYLTTIPAGTGNESMGSMYYLSLTARHGGSIMNSALTEMTLATEANINTATKIKQLADNGYTTTTFSESKFETGKVAFIEMGPWKLIDYSRIAKASADCDFEYSEIMPLFNGGDTSSTLGLYSLVITNKSKNKELAADFIKYVSTNKDIQLKHNTVQNLMPVTKEAINDSFYQTDEWQIFTNQLNHVVARPGSAAWPSIEKYIAEFVTGLVNKSREVNYIYSLQAALTEKLSDLDDE